MDKRVFFQKSRINLVKILSGRDKQFLSVIRNFNDLVFQIWPKLNYDAHKEYNQLLKKKQQLTIQFRTQKQKLLHLKENSPSDDAKSQISVPNSNSTLIFDSSLANLPMAQTQTLAMTPSLMLKSTEEQDINSIL